VLLLFQIDKLHEKIRQTPYPQKRIKMRKYIRKRHDTFPEFSEKIKRREKIVKINYQSRKKGGVFQDEIINKLTPNFPYHYNYLLLLFALLQAEF
jgi:hypothetical protein